MMKLDSNRKTRTSELNACVEHALLLFRVFVKTAQRTIVRLESLETNYLAVIYECLSNLDAIIVLLERKQPDIYYQPMIVMAHNEIRDQRLRYFAALRRGEYGLYYFKDGAAGHHGSCDFGIFIKLDDLQCLD